MQKIKINKIEKIGQRNTYDIWNKEDVKEPNFIANGVVVHNSIPKALENRDDPSESWRAELRKMHPIFEEVLGTTLGILCYQEQLTALWQRIGGFSASEAQAARKDIAKKRKDKIGKIRELWINGAQKILGKEEATKYFDSVMVSFGSYAFNKCILDDTLLRDEFTGVEDTVKGWYSKNGRPHLKSFDGEKVFVDKCVEIHDTGIQEVFEIEFENGKKESVTMDHRFLCSDGKFHAVRDIIKEGLDVVEVDAS
jgi:intein/homing endonuclease